MTKVAILLPTYLLSHQCLGFAFRQQVYGHTRRQPFSTVSFHITNIAQTWGKRKRTWLAMAKTVVSGTNESDDIIIDAWSQNSKPGTGYYEMDLGSFNLLGLNGGRLCQAAASFDWSIHSPC